MQRSDKSSNDIKLVQRIDPRTVRNNISALRLLIRTVHPGNPDEQNSSVLTGELIRQFERIRLAAVKQNRSDVERARQFAVMWFKRDPSSHHEKCVFTMI